MTLTVEGDTIFCNDLTQEGDFITYFYCRTFPMGMQDDGFRLHDDDDDDDDADDDDITTRTRIIPCMKWCNSITPAGRPGVVEPCDVSMESFLYFRIIQVCVDVDRRTGIEILDLQLFHALETCEESSRRDGELEETHRRLLWRGSQIG